MSQRAMIKLVHGGSKEMTVLKIWQREWKPIRLKELAIVCANRNAELLFNSRKM